MNGGDGDDEGLHPRALRVLGSLLDSPVPDKVRHLRVRTRRGFERAWCKADGVWLTDARDCVTCQRCRREVERRRKKV